MRSYQESIKKYDVFDGSNGDLGSVAMMTKVLGLAGETGEVCEKFKKVLRDKGGEMSEADKDEIVKELGDVLWYVATISRYMGVSLEEVAEKNIAKLEDRKERGRLRGSGDNR